MSKPSTEIDLAVTSGNSPPEAKKRSHVVAEGFKNRTWGEGVFNIISYALVGFFAVTASSILLTLGIKHTKTGSGYFNRAVDSLSEKLTFINPKKVSRREFIDDKLTIASLFTGGSIISILPIKWLEDRKAGIVQWLDKKHYGAERIANDPSLEQAHREMEAIPQQTWKSVGASRLSSFIATYATSFLIGSAISSFSIRAGRSIDWFSNYNNAAIGDKINHARKTSPKLTVANERMPSIIWGYIVLDAIYTAITSASLFSFTRIFAPLLGKESPPEALATEPSPIISKLPAPKNDLAEPTKPAPSQKIGRPVREGSVATAAQTVQM